MPAFQGTAEGVCLLENILVAGIVGEAWVQLLPPASPTSQETAPAPSASILPGGTLLASPRKAEPWGSKEARSAGSERSLRINTSTAPWPGEAQDTGPAPLCCPVNNPKAGKWEAMFYRKVSQQLFVGSPGLVVPLGDAPGTPPSPGPRVHCRVLGPDSTLAGDGACLGQLWACSRVRLAAFGDL